MKNKNKNYRDPRLKTHHWLLLLFVLLMFLYFIPRSIMYPDFMIVGWLIYASIFGLLPYIVYKSIDSFNNNSSWSVGLAALSVLIVGPTFGLFQGYRATRELREKGIWTKAVVVEEEYMSRKTYHSWVIRCCFNVDGKNYETNLEEDEENKFATGDTLDLIYSKEFPKIYKMGYQWTEK